MTPAALAVVAAEYLDTRVLLSFVGAFLMTDAVQGMNYRFMLVQGGVVAPRAIPLRERTRGGYVKPMGRREAWNWRAGQYESEMKGWRE